jgi:hypothetical protein
MVRSILFTGDCAAARAVHEKKMEERRLSLQGAAGRCPDEQPPGHGSAATPAPSESAAGLHSKSRLRKSTGTGTYAASANPVKKEINEYLACLASRQGPDTWVLALETRDLLTVASLVAVGFHPGRIVVPNPDRWEVEAMHGEDRLVNSSQVLSRAVYDSWAPDRFASERMLSSAVPRASGHGGHVTRAAAGARG